MQLEPGAKLSERLTLIAPVGQGGMGNVWIAEHSALGANVAVKVLNEKYAQDGEAIARFSTEARSLARIVSDNVVRIYDFATTVDGLPYMVMELLEGEDLERVIRRESCLSLAQVATVLAQTCEALAKIHEAGIVHRDVKPENVFLTTVNGNLRVKLFDFGIAKDQEKAGNIHITRTGTTVGTPLYMSPEQVLGGASVDFKCDLWGLAVVAYHGLVGKPPFEGETYGALCVAIHKAKFPPVSTASARRDLPATLDAWFAKALARDPRQRFASAYELRDTFLEASGLVASAPGPALTSVARAATAAVQSIAPVAREVEDEAMSLTTPRGRPGRKHGIARALVASAIVGIAAGAAVPARGWRSIEAQGHALALQAAETSALGARLFPRLANATTESPARTFERADERRGLHRESDELARAYDRDDATALDIEILEKDNP